MAQSQQRGDALQPPNGSTLGRVSPASSQRGVSPSANRDRPKGIVIFSGGSAANNLVDVFEHVREANECSLSYVIPISDNGGSTSEIIRVFGGPGRTSTTASDVLSLTL